MQKGDRVLGRDGVEVFTRGVALFLEERVIVACTNHPATGGKVLCGDKGA